jgi:DNA modification methylase
MIELVDRKVSELIPYINNARTHSDAQVTQIAASIKEFGFTNPLLIDGDNGVIAGHGRLMAAKKLGMEQVPTIELSHLTPTQKKAYILADNKLALNADWNDELLKLELIELNDADFDLSLIGFDDFELDALLDEGGTEGLTDEDEVPDAPAEPVTKRGDVWLCGEHRVMCGDSTMIDDVEKLMDGKKAELCFTSPPYTEQREYNGGKELSTEYLVKFISTTYGKANFFAINLGYSRKDGSVDRYWDYYIKEAILCGLKLLSWNVWDKGECGSIGNQAAMFGITHEWIFVFGNDRKELNLTEANKSAGEQANHTGNRQADGLIKKSKERIVRPNSQLKTVYQCVAQKARDDINHPARFPVEFAQGYIEAMTDSGQYVYDPFGGSGSTLIACEKTNRINYSMELDERYCDVIVKRWQDFVGKQATLEATGETFSV